MVNEENITTEQEENAFNEEQEVQEKQEKSDDLSFVELYEQSLQEVPTGQIVTGRVVQVNDDVIMIDVGYKTEGRLNINEVKDDEGNVTISEGDEIEVLVDRKKDDDLILSRDKAVKLRVWDDIIKAHDESCFITGKVVSRVKGGLAGLRRQLLPPRVDPTLYDL